MVSKRRKEVPILLNYTGEIVKINLPENDDRFHSQYANYLIIPPLGKPYVEINNIKEENTLFHTEICTVKGIPPPMKGVLYIVQENIAKILYGVREDLLIVFNKTVESAENPLKPEEIILVGDDLAHFVVVFEKN